MADYPPEHIDGEPTAGSSPLSQSVLDKPRRDLPAHAVRTLKAWLLSPAHITNPYPTPAEQEELMAECNIDKKQLKNWFTNARRR